MELPRVDAKKYYLEIKSLHGLHKLSTKAKDIQAGNRVRFNILFIIPVKSKGIFFLIYTVVSEICDNVNLVLCVKRVVELEVDLNARELKFKVLIMSVHVFPVNKEVAKPKERRFLKVKTQFLDEISGLGRIKLLELNTYDTMTIKVNFERNKAF